MRDESFKRFAGSLFNANIFIDALPFQENFLKKHNIIVHISSRQKNAKFK